MKQLATSVISLSNLLLCSLTIDLQTIQTTKSKKNNKHLQRWDDEKDTFQWHKGTLTLSSCKRNTLTLSNNLLLHAVVRTCKTGRKKDCCCDMTFKGRWVCV
jgi:hypothetical protein